jgi:hypothetical protein
VVVLVVVEVIQPVQVDLAGEEQEVVNQVLHQVSRLFLALQFMVMLVVMQDRIRWEPQQT